jgi:hypothetical protein
MMADGAWGGTPVLDLVPHMANVARDEHSAALAALRWTASPDAGAPWES